jgi:hypothetical protein
VLSVLRRHEAALAEDEEVRDAYRHLYRDYHPRVLCAEFNVALDRSLTGDADAEQDLRSARRAAEEEFGPDHPTVRAMRDRKRIDFDLEMPPT